VYFARRNDPLHRIAERLGTPGIVAIDVAGVQGAGKTTLLTRLFDEVNENGLGNAAWVSMRGLRPASPRDDSLESLERDFYAFCDVIDAFARDLGMTDFTSRISALRNAVADVPQPTVNVVVKQNVKLGLLSRIDGNVQWGNVRIDADEPAPAFFRRAVELARIRVRDEFASQLGEVAGRPVLFADDFELALHGRLGTWLLELVGRLDEALMVVARSESLTVLGGLAGALVELKIPNFDGDDLRRYLADRLDGAAVPEEIAERVAILTGGHPQAVVLAADLLCSHGADRPDVLSLFDGVRGELESTLAALVRRLVDDIGEDDVRKAVEMGCVLRRFDATALNTLLGRTEDDVPLVDDLRAFSFTEQHVQPETRQTYFRFHEFIRSELDAHLARTQPDRYRELHTRAASYYADWLTSCEEIDRDKAAYCRAYRYERPEWQAMVHEWLYHLMRLGDQQTSVEVARVYLAAFWWWGCYLRFPFCERLLHEWEMADAREQSREVAALLRRFQSSYPPEAEPDVVEANWLQVEDAMEELLDLEQQIPVGADDDAEWRRAQLRAYLRIFLAHARRGQDPADPAIDAAYQDAHDEFVAQGQQDDAWNLPWIEYELGDVALARGDLPEAFRRAQAAVEQASGPAAQQDNEVLANAQRLLGDVAWGRRDPETAIKHYELAMLHAFALQGMPKPADFYTITFYDRMARYVTGRLADLPSQVPDDTAAGAVLDQAHAFWHEYWRRAGEPVLADEPLELLMSGRVDELQPYLFPPRPGQDDVGAGSDYVTTAKRVAKVTFARQRSPAT
jgi:hypothetical protein